MSEIRRRRKVTLVQPQTSLRGGKDHISALNKLAEKMAKLYAEGDRVRNELVSLEVEARGYMNASGLKLFPTAYGSHKFEATKGKATRVIDVEGFRELVTDEQFKECINIAVGKAEEFVSKMALAKLSNWKDAKTGPAVYSFERAK